jgi:GT2 family glycosyltransferase
MGSPKIAIGIVSYERADLTRRCIASVKACTPEGSYRIFLIDNGSRSAEAVAFLDSCLRAQDISLRILDKNHGPAYARNIILEMIGSSCPVVAFFDNDIVCLPGWAEAGLKGIDEGADLIQPKLLAGDGRTVERGPTRPRENPLAANPRYVGIGFAQTDPAVNKPGDAVIVGGTGIIRREVFDRIGRYDDRLHVGEDFDLSCRARDAGFSLRYVPDCVLIHDHVFELAYDQERGKAEKYLMAHVFYWRKHGKAILSPQYLHWYAWLHFHHEPMYMPAGSRWSSLGRRLRRRAARAVLMLCNQDHWVSSSAADGATERLAARLGI